MGIVVPFAFAVHRPHADRSFRDPELAGVVTHRRYDGLLPVMASGSLGKIFDARSSSVDGVAWL